MIVARIQGAAIDVAALRDQVQQISCGATVAFEGTTRSPSHGHEVRLLRYEAYESRANTQLHEIAVAAMNRWPLGALAAVHRVGDVPAGDTSVAVVAASPHRDEAFDACRYVIDRIKSEVAIWKQEVLANGDEQWL